MNTVWYGMCNCRAYFISEKCNVSDGIWSQDLLPCKTLLLTNELKKISSTNTVSRGCYEATTVPITLIR